MAYDEFLADRVKNILDQKKVLYTEKKMFGGIAYMVDEKMCVGITKEKLMARVNPDFYDQALEKLGSTEMNFTGKIMRGFLFIEPLGIEMEDDLEFWVQKCLDFNPLAKSSKKKKKS